MSDQIGFAGLGVMGLPMALNLRRAGHSVRGFNRSSRGRDEFSASGGELAGSIGELAAECTVVFAMLSDDAAVEEAVLGPDGIVRSARPGTLLIDCSTVSPATARRTDALAAERGLLTVDAPVSGGEEGARTGTLSAMVGGSAEAVRRARPYLDAVAGTVTHVGPPGAGQLVKAANQVMVAGHLLVLGEALQLLSGSSVDTAAALSALRGGLAQSAVLDRKAERMLAREFAPGFRIRLQHKDIRIALGVAEECNAPVPLTALAAQFLAGAMSAGLGEHDHAALGLVPGLLAGHAPE
ncbi:NAD(P)-dependent oxidoreductase [Amycolatopsis rubida]|uniref:2-hydroxy-3-oxopropionate reductase n=1 Tax=Amycolatopsis rubida TaxID=112413 RepID=A0A1I5ZG04_9PSEU|nr:MULTISPECIES: NAD(P)-dependent oxidoreductase [Amycolatopsis]MYW92991.1 NAD-binding protein [Amycolatopsis rubida]NEC57978.1 NAD(P)-dependent oxidoreductase [Amycolatopsis rubida]OAP25516.1 2-hydroxy-3-oxopropionate reductase [Amycolatopsis sp. M39]SFQ55449.1 2-hydroxy-3-oxopropionate reductase [Amycolatopsis rubida]